MRRVLAIDPGWTTGIAIYDENGELDMTMTVRKEKIYKNGFLNNLVKMSKAEVVLLESLPKSNVDKETQKLHTHLSSWFRTAAYELIDIQPSQWKGLATRVEIPGQHARDAATLGRWWIHREYNMELRRELDANSKCGK